MEYNILNHKNTCFHVILHFQKKNSVNLERFLRTFKTLRKIILFLFEERNRLANLTIFLNQGIDYHKVSK